MVLYITVKNFDKVGLAQFRSSKILYSIIWKFAELLSDYDNNDDDELFCVTIVRRRLFKLSQLTLTSSKSTIETLGKSVKYVQK